MIEKTCDKCLIKQSCPKNGVSPLKVESSGEILLCRLVGGYATKPVDIGILSQDSLELYYADGEYLTIAEVPYLDGKHVRYEIVKVFHQKLKHERDDTNMILDRNQLKTAGDPYRK